MDCKDSKETALGSPFADGEPEGSGEFLAGEFVVDEQESDKGDKTEQAASNEGKEKDKDSKTKIYILPKPPVSDKKTTFTFPSLALRRSVRVLSADKLGSP